MQPLAGGIAMRKKNPQKNDISVYVKTNVSPPLRSQTPEDHYLRRALGREVIISMLVSERQSLTRPIRVMRKQPTLRIP